MKFVQPVRDKDQVREITQYLAERNERDMVMWLTGIYTGLRISDILTLRVRHVRDANYINIVEQKTKKMKKKAKTKRIHIVPKLKRVLDSYIADKPGNEFLFKSREGRNRPITRVRAYEILKEAADDVGVKEVGTHTMRKTFGISGIKEGLKLLDLRLQPFFIYQFVNRFPVNASTFLQLSSAEVWMFV